jgi:hypothetical protein
MNSQELKDAIDHAEGCLSGCVCSKSDCYDCHRDSGIKKHILMLREMDREIRDDVFDILRNS